MLKAFPKALVLSSLSWSAIIDKNNNLRGNIDIYLGQSEVFKQRTNPAFLTDSKLCAFSTGTMEAMNDDFITSSAVRSSVKKGLAGGRALFQRPRPSSAATTASLLSATAPILPKQRGLQILLLFLIISVLAFSCMYKFHGGFRRTCDFWRLVAPIVAEFKMTKWKAKYIDRCNEEEYKTRMNAYHQNTAPKAVEAARKLGGIYIKMGQFISTLGAGIFREEYVRALRPVLNGIPARSIEEIKEIFEQSTGRKVEDIFETFEETPVGAASIAQAHRATLRTNNGNQEQQRDNEVIVKVQYPEISEQLRADMNNMELLMKLTMASDTTDDLIRTIRDRHERELDFRIEAENLRECSANMQRHGMEPQRVRIPQVRNETGLCTENILVMEYLKGISLSDAIHDEQDRLARAFGHKDGEEFRSKLGEKMKEHFENGGGEHDKYDEQHLAIGRGGSSTEGGGKKEDGMISSLFDGEDDKVAMKLIRSVTTGGPLMGLVRTYADVREGLNTLNQNVRNLLFRNSNKYVGYDESIGANGAVKRRPHVNIARALKTLVYVHGLQVMKDGVYNADPHPGNVVVMDDGRLGLLDYGMVVRLDPDERKMVSKTILALSHGDKNDTVSLYASDGYKAQWSNGDEITDVNALHRIAKTHFDSFDLSPVRIMDRETKQYKKVPAFKMLSDVRERAIPNWIENGRRLAGLLIGVSAQAARPISLAKEWEPIAAESLGSGKQYAKQRRREKSKQEQVH